jgi:conjugal transfer ATP-binding protein TraC
MKNIFTNITSTTVENFRSAMKKDSFTAYLPYSVYDDITHIYHHNDGSYCFMVEINPRIRASGSTASAMKEILDKLPNGTYLQNFYFGSSNLKKELDAFREEHSIRGKKENVEDLIKTAEAFYDFFKQKTNESITTNMTTYLKKIRICFAINSNSYKKINEFKKTFVNILESNAFSPKIVNPKELFLLNYEILNPDENFDNYPDYTPNRELNIQMSNSNNGFYVDDNYFQIGKSKSWINHTLKDISNKFHISEFGAKLGNYLGESVNVNQFKDNFIISIVIKKKSKTQAANVSRNHAIIIGQKWPTALFRKFANVQKESIDIKDRIDSKNEILYSVDVNVLVSGKTPEQADENAQTIESFWAKSGGGESKLTLARTRGIHHLALISNLLGTVNDEFFENLGAKYTTKFADQASNLFAVESDFTGAGTNLPLISTRGSMSFLDLFLSNNNFNGYCVATSGAGKSVLLQLIAFLSYLRGNKIFVLDYDNSFASLINVIGGQYLNLDPTDRAISFNPFTSITTRAILMEELEYISSFIYLIGSSKSTQRAEEDEKLIKTELQKIIPTLWDTFHEKLEITNIRDSILKQFDKDLRFKDFAMQLGRYCRGGLYEGWFCGPCEFDITNDFMGVEFKGVENHPDLRDPLIMLLLYHIGKVMYSTDVEKPTIQVILDEAHRFIDKNPRMDDFIEQAYRRARKFKGSILIATQGFDDIYITGEGLSKVGKVIINNSAWKIVMKQTAPSLNSMLQSKVFSFSRIEEMMLKQMRTRKGEYSEFFLMSPDDEKSTFRLVMPRYFYYLTTSDARDKEKIAKTMNSLGLVKSDAIREIIKNEI